MLFIWTMPVVESAIAQVRTKITAVLIAVAKFEFMPDTPIFAKTAVKAANKAESKA